MKNCPVCQRELAVISNEEAITYYHCIVLVNGWYHYVINEFDKQEHVVALPFLIQWYSMTKKVLIDRLENPNRFTALLWIENVENREEFMKIVYRFQNLTAFL